jgi:hypothetical protein
MGSPAGLAPPAFAPPAFASPERVVDPRGDGAGSRPGIDAPIDIAGRGVSRTSWSQGVGRWPA